MAGVTFMEYSDDSVLWEASGLVLGADGSDLLQYVGNNSELFTYIRYNIVQVQILDKIFTFRYI